MDELREKIWDYLYRADGPKSIDEIAEHVNEPGESIRTAIDHEWFKIVADKVTIA